MFAHKQVLTVLEISISVWKQIILSAVLSAEGQSTKMCILSWSNSVRRKHSKSFLTNLRLPKGTDVNVQVHFQTNQRPWSCWFVSAMTKLLALQAPWCCRNRPTFSRQRIVCHHTSLPDYSSKAKLGPKLTQSHIPKSICTFSCNQKKCLLLVRRTFNSSWTMKGRGCILFDSLVHVSLLFLAASQKHHKMSLL